MDSRFHRNTNRTRSTKLKMADFFRVEFLYYSLNVMRVTKVSFVVLNVRKAMVRNNDKPSHYGL